MRKLLFLFLIVAFNYAQAVVNPTDLIKVTSENNPNCIEYYYYKNALYCSTSAQSAQPIDPEIKNYETQKIKFDNRIWQIAWGKKTSSMTTVEYVPAGNKIENWHELVTSQFISSSQNMPSPKDYIASIIQKLKTAGLNPEVNMFETSSSRAIFEFRITAPSNLQQDELQKFTKSNNGIYLLHYVIKKADMGKKARMLWIQNLKDSEILPKQ